MGIIFAGSICEKQKSNLLFHVIVARELVFTKGNLANVIVRAHEILFL